VFASFTSLFALCTLAEIEGSPSVPLPIANRPQIKRISRLNATIMFGIPGAQRKGSRQFISRESVLPILNVRNAWSGLDSFEKIAVVLSVVALTLAAWTLGSLATP
jgi:hypothetical protein